MRKPKSNNYGYLKWEFLTMQSFCIHSFFCVIYEKLWFWSHLFYWCYRAPPCLWLNFWLYQEENVGMLDSPSPVSFLMHRLRAPVQGLLICWSTIVQYSPTQAYTIGKIKRYSLSSSVQSSLYYISHVMWPSSDLHLALKVVGYMLSHNIKYHISNKLHNTGSQLFMQCNAVP